MQNNSSQLAELELMIECKKELHIFYVRLDIAVTLPHYGIVEYFYT